MSLANVLAVAQSAKTVVLIGDPQQLDQPIQGSHPVSALHHILDGAQAISADRGLFLEETWRLHPDICAFTSELFYADQLRSRQGLKGQLIAGSPVAGAGLYYLPVPHTGNQNKAPEETDAIAALVAPRGMEFLYSLNRVNVATSRATCVSVLVASPQLFKAECRTPRQIQLANAFCRYLELAQELPA